MADIQIGIIDKVDNKNNLATASTDGRTTDWLKVISVASAFKKHFTPLRVGDQVLIVNPFGKNENGFILSGVFAQQDIPAGADDNVEIFEYEDGTVVKIDLENKVLELNTPNTLTIVCKEANITANSINLKGDTNIDGNLKVSGTIDDKKGTLTDHYHSVSNHSKAEPRP